MKPRTVFVVIPICIAVSIVLWMGIFALADTLGEMLKQALA